MNLLVVYACSAFHLHSYIWKSIIGDSTVLIVRSFRTFPSYSKLA